MSVWITEVVSPDLFYAIPVPNKGKKKCSLFLIPVRSHCCKLVNKMSMCSEPNHVEMYLGQLKNIKKKSKVGAGGLKYTLHCTQMWLLNVGFFCRSKEAP